MIRIEFKSRNGREVRRFYRMLPIVSKKIIGEMADDVATEMKANVRTWKGYLKSTIKTVDMGKKAVGIKEAHYGLSLEYGGHPFVRTPKLAEWAKDKKLSMWYLINVLQTAQSHPFIKPSIKTTRIRRHSIVNKHLNNLKWRSGLR